MTMFQIIFYSSCRSDASYHIQPDNTVVYTDLILHNDHHKLKRIIHNVTRKLSGVRLGINDVASCYIINNRHVILRHVIFASGKTVWLMGFTRLRSLIPDRSASHTLSIFDNTINRRTHLSISAYSCVAEPVFDAMQFL